MSDTPRHDGTTRGFSQTGRLLRGQIRKATESRGFAEARILTHWAEIVGPETAAICRPVEVSYAKGGMGATLTLLTTGPQAPMLEMEKPRLIEKINACYGYRAIARLRITQTAPTGFAEGQAVFAPAPRAPRPPDPEITARAQEVTDDIGDTELRLALRTLAANVLSKRKS